MRPVTKIISHISVVSALKVGFVTFALFWSIVVGILFMLDLTFGTVGMLAAGGQENANIIIAQFGVQGYLITILIYTIVGAIATGLGALLYNLVAAFIGGIEIELE